MSVDLAAVLVCGLATWCLAVLLYAWKGFRWLRDFVYSYSSVSKVFYVMDQALNCFWCCALISGIISMIGYWITPWLVFPLTCAGFAILAADGGRLIWRMMTDG